MLHSVIERLLGAALVVVLVVALPAAAARGPGHEFGHDFGRHLDRMAEKLGLSDEQRRAVEAIHAASRTEAEPLRAQVQASRKAMHELVRAESFDESGVRALVQQGSAAMTELAVLRARTGHAMRALLTPEQRVEFDRMHEARHAERGGGGRHDGGKRRNCRGKGDGSGGQQHRGARAPQGEPSLD